MMMKAQASHLPCNLKPANRSQRMGIESDRSSYRAWVPEWHRHACDGKPETGYT